MQSVITNNWLLIVTCDFISLSLFYERLLYSTGKTSTWCKPPPPSFLPFGEILSSYCHMWHNFTKLYFMHHWTSHWGPGRKASPQWPKGEKILRLGLSFSCNSQQLWFSWQNTHGPHTTNPHSDSSYLNIFFRLPTFSTFQNTHIYRSTIHRIMVQVEGL